jgi:ABC-type enterochelin transport system permease subunit
MIWLALVWIALVLALFGLFSRTPRTRKATPFRKAIFATAAVLVVSCVLVVLFELAFPPAASVDVRPAPIVLGAIVAVVAAWFAALLDWIERLYRRSQGDMLLLRDPRA